MMTQVGQTAWVDLCARSASSCVNGERTLSPGSEWGAVTELVEPLHRVKR